MDEMILEVGVTETAKKKCAPKYLVCLTYASLLTFI